VEFSTHHALLATIAVTTVCWVLTAFLGPQTDRKVLIEFYRKVRPFGPGWRSIREEAGISKQEAAATHENIPLALLGWSAGCAAIWSSLFTVGNFLYGRMGLALVLFVVFIASGLILLYVINQLWANNSGGASPALSGKNPNKVTQ
jgi:solute:Na+ symporter, SSS family